MSKPKIRKPRAWTQGQIYLASFVGGPFAGPFLISRNAKTFGHLKEAKQLIFYGVIFTTLIFGAIACIPDRLLEKIPHFIFPLIYTTLIQAYVQFKQKADIDAFLEKEENQRFSYWLLLPISILFAAISVIWGFVIGVASDLVYFW